MVKQAFRAVLVVGVVVASMEGLHAQHAWRGPLVYPEKLHSDIEVLRSMVHQVHPDPYRYIARPELDRRFNELHDSVRVPMDEESFLSLLGPVVASIGDANLIAERDPKSGTELGSRTPVLPLRVRVLDAGLFVEEELKGFRTLAPGSRIRSINGIPASEIVERLHNMVPGDGANATLRSRLVERDFPWLLLRAYGEASSFNLVFDVPGGGRMEEMVFALTGEEIERSRKPVVDVQHPWRSLWEPESATLWVTLSTLNANTLEASGQSVERFLSEMVKELRTGNARTLVLDVRDASGHDLSIAEQVFACIAREPFRLVQGMSLRSGKPPAGYEFTDPHPEHYASIGQHYLPNDASGVAYLRPDDPRLGLIRPNERAFEGKVYVVCDGGTRDAAAAFVMLAKRSGRARIVGEETGTNALSFTGGEALTVVAPNSGVRLHIPLVRYQSAGTASGPQDRGEQPHHTTQQQPWGIAKGRDTVRAALLEMIKELQ